jgi:hypothetical protein
MTKLKVLDRIRKLLELSNSDNANEAAMAAARAATLMVDYQIEEAELAPDVTEDEPVTEETIASDGRRVQWKLALVNGLAKSLGCACYYNSTGSGTKYQAVGPKSALETITYMYSYLVKEVGRLADVAYAAEVAECDSSGVSRPSARGWKGSFRVGCSRTISSRLIAQRVTTIAKAKDAGKTQALMVVDRRALVVKDFMTKSVGPLRRSTTSAGRSSRSGLKAGRTAGAGVSLGNNRGALGSGSKQLSS